MYFSWFWGLIEVVLEIMSFPQVIKGKSPCKNQHFFLVFHWVPSNGSTKPNKNMKKTCVYHLLRDPVQSARLLKSPVFLSSAFHTENLYVVKEI